MSDMKLSLLFLSLVCFAAYVDSRPNGAPMAACDTLFPQHGSAENANDRPGDFFIYSELFDNNTGGDFMGNASYRVTLATTNRAFRGFLIQAVDADNGDPIGYFMIMDSANSQLLTCNSNTGSTVTHTNKNDKTLISFYWNAPTYDGTVDFRYTVVIAFAMNFYGNISAAMNRPSCFVPSPSATGSTYTFTFGESGDDYYLRARVNPVNSDYADIALEGTANGWIATGFSTNMMMENDDVLGCRVDSGSVVVRDAWNPDGRYTANVVDSTQTDICLHSGSFTDGRISCSFSRLINGSNSGQDYNLDDSYWLLYARRTAEQTSGDNFGKHTNTPNISDKKYNILQSEEPTDSTNTTNSTDPPQDMGKCNFEPSGSDDRALVTEGSLGSGDYALVVKLNPNNNEYMDFYLEGVANGWVAAGISEDQTMGGDDVLGCRVDGDSVTVVDTWNIIGSRGNQLDSTQTDICYHSKSFTDGRIVCVFSRLIQGANGSPQDFNLATSDGFYLLYGRRTTAQTSGDALAKHTDTPTITSQKEIFAQSDSSASTLTKSFLLFTVCVLVVLHLIY